MKTCIECGQANVDPTDEARYDVLRPGADLDNPSLLGPYCADCFAETPTGQQAPVVEQHEA